MPFDQLVRDHGPRVLRVCRAVLARADVDDAWAETFLAALRAYPRLPEDADLAAWLATIAHRKCLDQLRREARSPFPVAAPGAGVPASAADPGEADDHSALYGALQRLTERQRLAVAHHHLGGLAYREVAEVIGSSEAAARRAAADGIKNLRRWLVVDLQGEVVPAPTEEDVT